MKQARTHNGFSLVEVVLALGIAVFCLASVFALLPIGQSSNKDTLRETAAASLAASISTDLRATPVGGGNSPYFGLAIPAAGATGTTNSFYVNDDGVTNASPSGTSATYLATVVLTPPVSASRAATTAMILVTWPATPSVASGSMPSHYLGSFQTVVALNRN